MILDETFHGILNNGSHLDAPGLCNFEQDSLLDIGYRPHEINRQFFVVLVTLNITLKE